MLGLGLGFGKGGARTKVWECLGRMVLQRSRQGMVMEFGEEQGEAQIFQVNILICPKKNLIINMYS